MANHIRLVGSAGWQCAGLVGLAWLAGLAPACLVGLAVWSALELAGQSGRSDRGSDRGSDPPVGRV